MYFAPHRRSTCRHALVAVAALAGLAGGCSETPKGIDTHIHLYESGRVVWSGPMARLNPSHLPADFIAASAGTPIGRAVLIEASENPAENDWMLESAARDPAIAAVIGNVRLDGAGFAAEVDRLAAHPKFRGIRDRTAAPIERASPQTSANLRHLSDRGLVLEVQARPDNDAWILETATAYPGLTMIINHLGNPRPDARGEPRAGWHEFIARAGVLPNVYCKLSAFDSAQGASFPPPDAGRIAPLLDHIIDSFGHDRVLFGSNWPVSPRVGHYRDMAALLMAYAAVRPDFPADRVLTINPQRAYGLPPQTTSPR